MDTVEYLNRLNTAGSQNESSFVPSNLTVTASDNHSDLTYTYTSLHFAQTVFGPSEKGEDYHPRSILFLVPVTHESREASKELLHIVLRKSFPVVLSTPNNSLSANEYSSEAD